MTLGCFFDDAGTHDESDVVSWGGLVGNLDQWSDLTDAWYRRLDVPFPGAMVQRPRLKKFHLWDCVFHNGEFADYSEPERSNLQYEFRKIIGDAGLIGVCYSIDRKAYDRLVPDGARAILGGAEEVCFRACFDGAYEQAHLFFRDEQDMIVYFDKVGNTGRLDCLSAIVDHQVEQRAGQVPFIVGVQFGKVEKFPPLQAADIIATEQCWLSKRLLGYSAPARDFHFESYLKMIRAVGRMMSEEQIIETIRSVGFEPNPS